MEYKNNKLKEVIMRVDFVKPVLILREDLDNTIIDTIMDNFPETEFKDSYDNRINIKTEDGGVKQETTVIKKKEYNFYSNNKSSRLCISDQFYFITVKKYCGYDRLEELFFSIFTKLCSIYEEIRVARIGLRIYQ